MGKMMKMTFAGIFMAVVVLGVTSAFAAGPGAKKNFTDANRDGICDYRENVCCYMDTNADGICDNCGRKQKGCISQNGCGKNYVDTDHDGICDRIENGRGYADAAGDGVCDHAARQGLARGKGFRGGRGR